MKRVFSKTLSDDLIQTIDSELVSRGIINIPMIAEQVRRRNEQENIALEDIAHELLLRAQLRSAPMEFDAPLYRNAVSSNSGSDLAGIIVVSEK